jgi:hypothetical protein
VRIVIDTNDFRNRSFSCGYQSPIYQLSTTMTKTQKQAEHLTRHRRRKPEPLRVKLLNSKGQEIEGIILSGKMPTEDPTLAIARELGKHKHLEPTPIP